MSPEKSEAATINQQLLVEKNEIVKDAEYWKCVEWYRQNFKLFLGPAPELTQSEKLALIARQAEMKIIKDEQYWKRVAWYVDIIKLYAHQEPEQAS